MPTFWPSVPTFFLPNFLLGGNSENRFSSWKRFVIKEFFGQEEKEEKEVIPRGKDVIPGKNRADFGPSYRLFLPPLSKNCSGPQRERH